MKLTTIKRPVALLFIALGAFLATACGPSTTDNSGGGGGGGGSSTVPTILQRSPIKKETLESKLPDGQHLDNFEKLYLLPPRAANCQDPGADQIFSFAVRAYKNSSEAVPITPGDFVEGVKVAPNGLLNLGLLDIAGLSLQPAPASSLPGSNVDYKETTDPQKLECDPATANVCGTDGDFSCSSVQDGSIKQCTRPTSLSFKPNSLKYDVAGPKKKKIVTFLFDTSNLMRLANGQSVGNYTRFLKEFRLTSDASATTYFDFIRYGTNGIIHRRCENTEACMKQMDANEFGKAIGDLTSTYAIDDTNLAKDRPQMFFSAANTLGINYYGGELKNKKKRPPISGYPGDDAERFAIIFTAGPPNHYVNNEELVSYNFKSVIETLKKYNVRTFIIHVDPKIDSADEANLFTHGWDQSIVAAKDNSNLNKKCNDDSECLHYEECRLLKDENNSDIPGDKFCRPKFVDGRVGPIAGYADIACETRGGYYYLDRLDYSIDEIAESLAAAIDGLYTAEATFSGLPKKNTPTPYRISGSFSFTLLNRISVRTLAPMRSSDGLQERLDTRLMLWAK